MHRKIWLRFTTDQGQDGGGDGAGDGGGFTPITTQEELNKVIQERVNRERNKYADYKTLKDKAAELDRLKSENQTADEKSQQQITELQQQLEQMQLTTLKAKVQASHGISDEDADLFLTGTDEDTLTRQAKALADRDTDRKKKGPVVPTQGNHPTKTGGDEALREFTRGVFGRTG